MTEEYVDPHAPQPEEAPLPTHAGPLPAEDDDFFAPLPAEIGEPFSVHTNWKQDKKIRSLKKRFIAAGITAGILFLVIWGGAHFLQGAAEGIVVVVGGIVGVTAVLLSLLLGKSPLATYVGRDGWSRHKITATRPEDVRDEILLFANADTLHTQETRNYQNGIYTGTAYAYQWKDSANKLIGKINGMYQSKEGTPKPADKFWFAKSAEAAWSEHWMARTMPEFEANGFVVFRFGTDKVLHIGKGFMEIHWGKKEHVVEQKDIAQIGFQEGTLKIQFHDKAVMKKGKFNVGVKDIPNFRCFVIALERLFGYRFGP